jgi:hypothetical protein
VEDVAATLPASVTPAADGAVAGRGAGAGTGAEGVTEGATVSAPPCLNDAGDGEVTAQETETRSRRTIARAIEIRFI